MEDNIKLLTVQKQQGASTSSATDEPDEVTQMLMNMSPDDVKFIEAQFEHARNKRLHEEELEYTPVSAAINNWLLSSDFGPETRKNYAYYIADLQDRTIIPKVNAYGKPYTLGELRYIKHQENIDHLKQIADWSDGTRQLRISCYISFMSYLAECSDGWFRKPKLQVTPEHSAYYQAQYARATKALTLAEWQQFISALHAIDGRDALMARLLLQHTTLIMVLSLRLSQVNFDMCTITFRKQNGMEAAAVYPAFFMQELKKYVDESARYRADSDLVFVTRNAKQVVRSRCNYSFMKASKTARIKHVTPYAIKATYITLVRGDRIDGSTLLQIPDVKKEV